MLEGDNILEIEKKQYWTRKQDQVNTDSLRLHLRSLWSKHSGTFLNVNPSTSPLPGLPVAHRRVSGKEVIPKILLWLCRLWLKLPTTSLLLLFLLDSSPTPPSLHLGKGQLPKRSWSDLFRTGVLILWTPLSHPPGSTTIDVEGKMPTPTLHPHSSPHAHSLGFPLPAHGDKAKTQVAGVQVRNPHTLTERQKRGVNCFTVKIVTCFGYNWFLLCID